MSKADPRTWCVAVREALCLEPASGLELSRVMEEVSLWPRSQATATWRVPGASFQGSWPPRVRVRQHFPSVRMVSPGGSNIVKQRG